MEKRKGLLCLLMVATSSLIFGQTKERVIDNYVEAFNARDIEKFIDLFDESARIIGFPDLVREKSKHEIKESHLPAFRSKELTGEIFIVGKSEIGDLYVIEQSLKGFRTGPVDQYLIFKFKGNKIIEIQYLPKNFRWNKY